MYFVLLSQNGLQVPVTWYLYQVGTDYIWVVHEVGNKTIIALNWLSLILLFAVNTMFLFISILFSSVTNQGCYWTWQHTLAMSSTNVWSKGIPDVLFVTPHQSWIMSTDFSSKKNSSKMMWIWECYDIWNDANFVTWNSWMVYEKV